MYNIAVNLSSEGGHEMIFRNVLQREEVVLLLHCLYRACHLNTFKSTNQNELQRLIQDLVSGTELISKYYPEGGGSKQDIDEILHKTQNYDMKKTFKNPWLIPIRFPAIMCKNPLAQNGVITTMAKQLHDSKNLDITKISGTCKGCARDCNPVNNKSGIMLTNSKTFNTPNCSLKMTNVEEFSGFTLHIKIGINSDRYQLDQININSSTYFSLLNLLNRYAPKLVNTVSVAKVITKENPKKCRVKFSIVGNSNMSKGALAELINRGYYPMFKTDVTPEDVVINDHKVISKVSQIINYIKKACNPLYFENVSDLFSMEIPDLNIDYNFDNRNNTWDLLYCAANEKTLEKLLQEMTSETEDSLVNTTFREVNDGTMEYLDFEFLVDSIRFWMC